MSNSVQQGEPIKVETTVYGTPAKQGPNQFEEFSVETKITYPNGSTQKQVQPFQTPANPGPRAFNPQPTSPRVQVDERPYAEAVNAMGFNGKRKVYNDPNGTTVVTTTVINPEVYRVDHASPIDNVQRNARPVDYVPRNAAAATAPVRNNKPHITYEFMTFDPERVPQIEHAPASYQPNVVVRDREAPIRNNGNPLYISRPVVEERRPVYEDRRPVYEDRRPVAEDRRPVYEDRRPVVYDDRDRRPVVYEGEAVPISPRKEYTYDNPGYI